VTGADIAGDTILTPVADGSAVVVCTTCRLSADAREGEDGARGGARLAEALHAVRATDERYAAVAVQEMPCLFACKDFCTVHLRAPGKVGYVLGRFEPGEGAARAILDYARAYAQSEFGQVPFREWPQGVKGHFITRTPPEGYVVE
jgi:predicted metal-binding protein